MIRIYWEWRCCYNMYPLFVLGVERATASLSAVPLVAAGSREENRKQESHRIGLKCFDF